MSGTVWESPAPAQTGPRAVGRSKYEGVFADMKARPGAWAKIVEGRKSSGQQSFFTDRFPGFEVVSRKGEGGWTFYGRWPEAITPDEPEPSITDYDRFAALYGVAE